MTRIAPISLTRGFLVLALGLSVSCDDSASNACDDYVDYMCECHSADYDCGQLQNTYADPDSSDLDSCQIALEDQEAEDAENPDFVCGGDTGSAG